MYVYIGSPTSKLVSEHLRAAPRRLRAQLVSSVPSPFSSTSDYQQLPLNYQHEQYEPLLTTDELPLPLFPLTHRPARSTMGNLVSHSADEPDNRRAPTSTAELPTERDNDAAPALGARPNNEREPAARHSLSIRSVMEKLRRKNNVAPKTQRKGNAVSSRKR